MFILNQLATTPGDWQLRLINQSSFKMSVKFTNFSQTG